MTTPTDPTSALKLARDALAWLHDMAEGHKSIGHLYDGDCPDQLDRTRRDPACPACKALDKAAAALAAIDALPAPSGEPVAQIDRDGVLWLNTNPRRLPIGTKLYAGAAPAAQAAAPAPAVPAEPVATAWMLNGEMVNAFPRPPLKHRPDAEYWAAKGYSEAPLYATPQEAPAPLTDEQAQALWVSATIERTDMRSVYLRGLRDGERAHNITATPAKG